MQILSRNLSELE